MVSAGGGHPPRCGDDPAGGERLRFRNLLRSPRGRQRRRRDPRPCCGSTGAVAPGGANGALLDRLDVAGPFGVGNPEPAFAVPRCTVDFAKVVGEGHVRCRLSEPGGARLEAIAFRAADGPVGKALLDSRGGALHVAGALRRDRWRGRDGVKMIVADAAHPV